MGLVLKSGQTVLNMKVSIKKVKRMEMVDLTLLMEVYMKVNLIAMRYVVMGNINGLMANLMKVNG